MLHEALVAAEQLADGASSRCGSSRCRGSTGSTPTGWRPRSRRSSTSSSSRTTRRSAAWATASAPRSRAASSLSSASRAGPRAARPTRRSGSTVSTAPRSRRGSPRPRSRRRSRLVRRSMTEARLGRPPRSALDPHLLRHGDRRRALRAPRRAPRGRLPRAARRGGRWLAGCPASTCSTGRSHAARRPSRPCPRARRRDARPAARLPPAGDPSQPPARVPCRADAAGASELDARHEPRQPAPAPAARSSVRWSAGSSARGGTFPTAARGDAARLLGPRALERAAHGAVPFLAAARRLPARRGARRELGPHGREGGHLAALRPLRRPERRDGGRPPPVSRDRAGTGTCHGMAADRPSPPPQAARRVRGAPRTPRAGSRAPRVSRRRQHPQQRAVRGAVRRAPRPVAPRILAARPQLLFRPHPRDREWRERFGAARDATGWRFRTRASRTSRTSPRSSSTSTPSSATRARSSSTHSSAIVRQSASSTTRARRPGESWAAKNVVGKHYEELAASGAFYRAESFAEVVAGIERALAASDELSAERAQAVRRVVGAVDGHAAERVVDAVLEVLG